MVTVAARNRLNTLRTTLKLSAENGVKDIAGAVVGYRYSLTEAASADFKFGRSAEYSKLEKLFSTFYLPKASELKAYTAKAIALIDKVLATNTAEDIEDWCAGNDYY